MIYSISYAMFITAVDRVRTIPGRPRLKTRNNCTPSLLFELYYFFNIFSKSSRWGYTPAAGPCLFCIFAFFCFYAFFAWILKFNMQQKGRRGVIPMIRENLLVKYLRKLLYSLRKKSKSRKSPCFCHASGSVFYQNFLNFRNFQMAVFFREKNEKKSWKTCSFSYKCLPLTIPHFYF